MNNNNTNSTGSSANQPETRQGQAPSTGLAAGEARQSAGSVAAAAEAETRKTVEEVRNQGQEVIESARDQARRFAHEQKEVGAEKISSLAHAVEVAADELERSSPQLAGYARKAAAQIDTMSGNIREQGFGDILATVNDFARREPLAFFGTAMFAGFALTRFLKSTGRGDEATDYPPGLGASPADSAQAARTQP